MKNAEKRTIKAVGDRGEMCEVEVHNPHLNVEAIFWMPYKELKRLFE